MDNTFKDFKPLGLFFLPSDHNMYFYGIPAFFFIHDKMLYQKTVPVFLYRKFIFHLKSILSYILKQKFKGGWFK